MATRSSWIADIVDYAGGTTTFYTCPDDVTALVKFVCNYNSNGFADPSVTSLQILYHHRAGADVIPIWGWYENNFIPYQWPLWVALDAGDTIELYTDGVLLSSVALYGALLPAAP